MGGVRGALRACFWDILEASWVRFGASWPHLGTVLGASWGVLAASWARLKASKGFLAPLGLSRCVIFEANRRTPSWMPSCDRFFFDVAPETPPPNFQTTSKSYYENHCFEPSGDFNRKLSQDQILVPISPHFAFHNTPKLSFGEALGASWGRLGAS